MRRIIGPLVAGLFMVTLSACGGGGGASKGAFCDAARSSKTQLASLAQAFLSNDPKQLDSVNALVQSVASKAPSEIKGDMTTVAAYVKKYVDGIKAAGSDAAKKDALTKDLAPDQAKFLASAQKIDDYTKKECGFSLATDASELSSSAQSSSSASSSSSGSSASTDDFSFDTDAIDSTLSSFSSALSDYASDSTPN